MLCSLIMGIFGALLSFSVAQAGGLTPKRIYTCQYDGGFDAFTWQSIGALGIPTSGAATCIEPAADDYHCDKVVDANGNQLGDTEPGRGRYCGSDNSSQGDYPGIMALGQ